MQKLTSSQKGWFGIVIALWLIALAAMIFVLPKSTPATQATAGTGSLEKALSGFEQASEGPIVGQVIDPVYVYGDDLQAYIPLCAGEPEELAQMKLEVAEEDIRNQVNPNGSDNYILLAKGDTQFFNAVDVVSGDRVDMCGGGQVFQQPLSPEQLLVMNYDGQKWVHGPRLR